MEKWKDVVGFEGLYLVSENGKIKSISRSHKMKTKSGEVVDRWRVGRTMRQYSSGKGGYYKVVLSRDGIRHRLFVHRIVADAFVPNLRNAPVVNHKDGDKKNNCADNLEWCTQAHNLRHAADVGLRNLHAGKKPVAQYDMDGNLIKIWDSCTDASNELGGCLQNIWQCAKGKTRTAYGFKWARVQTCDEL